jgi:hypothetical protein
MIPDWLEPIRLIGTFLIWVILPVQLWSLHRGHLQYQKWQESEEAHMARWKSDMETAVRLLEECSHMRAQAEVALAQARRQAFKDGSAGGSNVPGGP